MELVCSVTSGALLCSGGACKELDIETVAVYSDADKNFLRTKGAIQAHYISPSLSPNS